MLRKMSAILLISMTFTIVASESEDYTIKSIRDVPDVCYRLAARLEEQPIFDGYTWALKPSKVLPLENELLRCIFDHVTSYATKVLGEKRGWHLVNGVSAWSADGKKIENAIILNVGDGQNRCSAQELKPIFQECIQKVSKGWVKVDPAQFPGILHKECPASWCLFIKKRMTFVTEDNFIRFLAASMALSKCIACDDTWICSQRGLEHRDAGYMWIKKDCYEQVAKAFDFSENSAQ